MKNESHGVGDLPADDPVMKDLAFFEQEFNGVMPLEVMVDTRKKGHALKDATLKRIDKLQQKMDAHPELSRSLSIADAVKYTRQAFYGGDSARYGLLTSTDKTFMAPYVDASQSSGGLVKAFMDEERQSTRITTQVADMGTAKMDVFMATLRAEVDSIFDPAKYKVILSGTSVVFLEGSKYMVQNLMISLVMALVLIAGLMALLFNSARMVLVSLVPNIIPLIATAGLMGYLEIPIKPSTLLVFSIALGIAVDDAIHYLSKYRYELKTSNHNIKTSVFAAIHESGVSMIYTSVVLFCGFSLFVFSDFGGTQALGLLVSFTLLVAMFTNLLILPSLLLSFENVMTTRSFDEPLLDIMDEEEDIDLSELQLETKEEGTV